jgi:hypothetical protein
MKVLAKLTILVILFFGTLEGQSQVIFTETFNEGNGSTSGTDETGGVSWSSSCGGCISGDLWEEDGGEFHNQDSNGPALWTSGTIDISGCSSFTIEFDYNLSGTFEGCGTGCNSVDWISLEYTLGGGGPSTTYSPSNSYFCNGGCADLDVVWDGSDGSGGSYSSSFISTDGKPNLDFEIGSQTWAGTEHIYIDNITVTCSVPLNLDTTKVIVPQIEEEEVSKQIIKIFTIDGRELNTTKLDFLLDGVYIVVYDDYSRERVGIIR